MSILLLSTYVLILTNYLSYTTECNELRINITPYHDNSTTISWDEPCGGADNYTVFLNETVNGGCTYKERNETFYAIPKGAVVHLQVVALRKNAAPICFPGINSPPTLI